ncbi:MAG: hypothetical protein OXC41_05000 [Gammaproteobacteria bacterium]|nr:hypothetical protein [Gammaproteobacteria bacterium]
MKKELGLEERVHNLERTIRTIRIAIIIFVGFLLYDVISKDSGSDIIFAEKVKSREFVLLGSGDQPVGHWDYKDTSGLKMYSTEGDHVVLTPESVTFYQDRLNPVVRTRYD